MTDMQQKEYVFFDLDGTISKSEINNTFDFVENYLVYKKRRGSLIRKYFITLLSRFIPLGDTRRRRFLINSFYRGLSCKDIMQYCNCCYLPLFISKVNKTVLEKIYDSKSKGNVLVLLTACTEVPAMAISEHLGFDICIPTTFRRSEDRIEGIGEDTFRDLKIKAVEKKGLERILSSSEYYVDEVDSEAELVKRFRRVFKVHNGSIEEMGET
jgi:phosphoserine phosphatase